MSVISPSLKQVATVFFDVPLAIDATQERELRYRRGIDFVLTRFPTIEVVQCLPATFALTIRGESRVIASLRELLVAERIGTVSIENPDRPTFRAAR
jgi:hypothetical protein